jgi:murein DD-endopeptidase MepM/ murein hydrolase activator NlpD
MGIYQFSYGRRVWVKRVASVCGVIVLIGVAGCSTNDRFGYNGLHSNYAATGSTSSESGYRSDYGHYSNSGYYGGDKRAPFASSSPDSNYGTSPVERSSLAPVANNGTPSYTSNHIKTAAFNGGNAMTLQTVSDDGGDGDYYNNNGAYGYGRQRASQDDNRSPYRGYDSGNRYGGQRYNDDPQYPANNARSDVHDREAPPRGGGSLARNGGYVVQPGDTLYSIAQRFGMSTADLADLNNLRGTDLQPGQRLRVNGGGYTASNTQPRPNSYPNNDGRGGYSDGQNAPRQNERYGNERNDYARYGDGDYRGSRPNETYASNQRGYSDERGASSNRRDQYAERKESNDRRPARDEKSTSHREKALPPSSSDYANNGKGRSGQQEVTSYTVKRGDTIYNIAQRNGISHRELADLNDIPMSAKLYPGQILHLPRGKGFDWGNERAQEEVPGKRSQQTTPEKAREKTVAATNSKPVKPSKPVAVAEVRAETAPSDPVVTGGPGSQTAVVGEVTQIVAEGHEETSGSPEGPKTGARECEALLANPTQRSAKTFREPVQGQIISKFGSKEDGSFNDGVNFLVPQGTPVKAAENGVVAYAGDELSGFGNLVLIRHSDGFVTAYAHNEEINVKRCEVVKRGQVIGKAGATGNANKPQVHFELRKDSKPVDPETFFSRS